MVLGVGASSNRYVVYFSEIDLVSGIEISRKQEGRPYSDFMFAFNFLAGIYHRNYRSVDNAVFVNETGTIIQIIDSKPNSVYLYYIEDKEG